MFTNEFDVILFGKGVNTYSIALECVNRNRRIMILEKSEDIHDEILQPSYIWEESLRKFPFLKISRKNKLSEFVWKGNEELFKFDIKECWKLDSIKNLSLMKKELEKFNVPIRKIKSARLILDDELNIKTDHDTFKTRICVLNHNSLEYITFEKEIDLSSLCSNELLISNDLELIKGFPITTNVLHINDVLFETPGYDLRYQSKIISNVIYPIHESEALISSNWLEQEKIRPDLRAIYSNELWLKNWKRKRQKRLILNSYHDKIIRIQNNRDIFLPKLGIMMLENIHDQLTFNFIGVDVTRSFRLAEIFSDWLDASLRKGEFQWSSKDFFMVDNQESSGKIDLYENAYLLQKLMGFLSNLEPEKIDNFISNFLSKLNNEEINLFLKGILPQEIIRKIIKDLNTKFSI
ncbi:MAG: hypothetical protein ACTSX4_14230 [Candidatus Helarchaeota archaeon]